jgi:hypothetical protein
MKAMWSGGAAAAAVEPGMAPVVLPVLPAALSASSSAAVFGSGEPAGSSVTALLAFADASGGALLTAAAAAAAVSRSRLTSAPPSANVCAVAAGRSQRVFAKRFAPTLLTLSASVAPSAVLSAPFDPLLLPLLLLLLPPNASSLLSRLDSETPAPASWYDADNQRCGWNEAASEP